MRLSNTKFKEIEEKAQQIIDAAGIVSPSVSVEVIAKNQGLNIQPYNLGDEISGALVVTAGTGNIWYDVKSSKVRQRFTIAHEISHYILHVNEDNAQDEKLFVDRTFIVKYRKTIPYTDQEMEQEMEANALAAALLMPESFINTELQKEGYSNLQEVELIEKLAKTFHVSVLAMTFRLSNLNIVI